MPLGILALALLAVAALGSPAGAQTAACMESGFGQYPGWHTFRYRERVRLCREMDRLDRQLDWEDARLRRDMARDPEWQGWREQECLVNTAYCDIPGVHAAPRAAPPPPLPPPPPVR